MLDDKISKIPGVASDGAFWISRILDFITRMKSDTKHLTSLTEENEETKQAYEKVLEIVDKFKVSACPFAQA